MDQGETWMDVGLGPGPGATLQFSADVYCGQTSTAEHLSTLHAISGRCTVELKCEKNLNEGTLLQIYELQAIVFLRSKN